MRTRVLGVVAAAAALALLVTLPSGPGPGLAPPGASASDLDGGHGAMPMVAVPAVASVPTAPDVEQDGWVVTADSATAGHPPGALVDGDLTTSWRSRGGARHTVVVDTGFPQALSGVRYTPRPEARSTDVATYVVEVSVDAVHWKPATSGRWPREAGPRTVRFAPASGRYVRLSLRGDHPGAAVGIAELDLLGPPRESVGTPPVARRRSAASQGRWSRPLGLPIVPVSAILLPHDKVLTFAAYARDNYSQTANKTQISIIDVGRRTAGHRTITNTHHEMFCTGLSVLADGRVVITGGSSAASTTIYDPRTNRFTTGPQMQIPRGYQTSVTLSDGRVFTIGGSWSGGEGGKDAEVLDRAGTAWTRLPGVTADAILTQDAAGTYRADNHAWLFADSAGAVFQAGPSRQMNWFTTRGDGTSTPAGLRGDALDAMNGNAVMYAAGRILTVGGAENYSESDATAAAYTIDIRQGPSAPVTVERVGDLPKPRTLANSVVLPTGDVLVTGGQAYSLPFSDERSVFRPALWSHATGQFRELAAEAIPRNYHSWSLLLPDGRVMAGGGGLCFDCDTNHPDVEIFSPPYLFRDDGSLRRRPRVTSEVPDRLRVGQRLTVRSPDPVNSWVAVRTGSSTHSIDSDQRRVVLPSRRTGRDTYRLKVPDDRGVMVPGSYLLFGITRAGTPSEGSWFRVS